MTNLRVASNNPHYLCGSAPCTICQEQRKAEQEARDRHPAGADLPAPLDFDIEDTADGRIIRLYVASGSIELDESMIAELHSAVVADLCIRDGCTGWARSGSMDGLCGPHRDAADALPVGGWRK